jgi:hypothetical protein
VVTFATAGISPANPAEPFGRQVVERATPAEFNMFLDRLMAAESSGRSAAKNPRSSALGPFQFIKSTFLDLTSRYFAHEIQGLSEAEILSLRTDHDLSRRAATAFSQENANYLRGRGHEPTFAHLRLAFLLGAADAAQILQAQPHIPIADLLSPAVVKANPFMRTMSVADLLEKSERDMSADRLVAAAVFRHRRPETIGRALVPRLTAKSDVRGCSAKGASCRVSALSKGRKG